MAVNIESVVKAAFSAGLNVASRALQAIDDDAEEPRELVATLRRDLDEAREDRDGHQRDANALRAELGGSEWLEELRASAERWNGVCRAAHVPSSSPDYMTAVDALRRDAVATAQKAVNDGR